MNKSTKNNQDQLNVMRKIDENRNLTQRDLAEELGFSLGKLNYCIKELQIKGFIKMNNFFYDLVSNRSNPIKVSMRGGVPKN